MQSHTDLPERLLRDVPIDDVYDVLSDEHRRRLLVALRREEMPQRLPSVALHLEGETERTTAVDRLYTCLYHNHVPKLERHDLVQYYDDVNLIGLTEHGALLADALDP